MYNPITTSRLPGSRPRCSLARCFGISEQKKMAKEFTTIRRPTSRQTKIHRKIFKNTQQILLDRWHLGFEQYLKRKKKHLFRSRRPVFQDNTGLKLYNSLKIHHTWPHSIQLLIMKVTFCPQVKIISHIFRLHYKSLLCTVFLDLKISRTIEQSLIAYRIFISILLSIVHCHSIAWGAIITS